MAASPTRPAGAAYKSQATWIGWRLTCERSERSPRTTRGSLTSLIEGARAMQGLDMSEFGLSKPPELTSWLDSLKDMWGMRGLLNT